MFPAYFAVWGPFLIGEGVDQGVRSNDFFVLCLIAGLYLFVELCLAASRFVANYSMMSFGLQILVDYRSFLLSRILSFRFSYFDRVPSGRLSTRLTSDVNHLQEFFSNAVVALLGNSMLLIGVSVGMLLINWKLGLAALCIVPFLLWASKYFYTRIRRRFGFMRTAVSNMNAQVGESITGIRDIIGLGARQSVNKEFEKNSDKLRSRWLEAVNEYGTYNPIINFITSMMSVVILAVGSLLYFRGDMSLGEIVAFLGYSSYFTWPLHELTEKFSIFQQAMASVDRLVEISNDQPEEDLGEKALGSFSRIQFENVSFSYRSDLDAAVKNLSFEILAGDKIALLGETGSGKSTTCSLLMRFYSASQGQILVDSTPVQDFDLKNYRERISWVSQDVTLFSESLRENIRFFDSQVPDEAIWEALHLVQLDSWVHSLSGQLDFKLTEQGASLSSGQRQLISLARAIVKKPRILILDEATSFIDSRTENMLQQALERLWETEAFKGMTALFVAHRLSTLRKCNRLLVFRDGRIVESGSFEDLMKQDGYAASLYRRQFQMSA